MYPLILLFALQTPAPPTPAPAPAPKPNPIVEPWAGFPPEPAAPTPAPNPTPTPSPNPTPKGPALLSDGFLYVVNDVDAQSVLVAAPEGMVVIQKAVGNATIGGRFVGRPTGDFEFLTFQGKSVFAVYPAKGGEGSVDLILVKTVDGIVTLTRRTVIVNSAPQPPPRPVDPLAAAIQTAYSADQSLTKATDRLALAVVYSMMASPNTMATVVTDTDFYNLVRARTDAAVSDRLRGIRNVLAAELKKIEVPGSAARTLTDADKAAMTDLLTRFATALQGVK